MTRLEWTGGKSAGEAKMSGSCCSTEVAFEPEVFQSLGLKVLSKQSCEFAQKKGILNCERMRAAFFPSLALYIRFETEFCQGELTRYTWSLCLADAVDRDQLRALKAALFVYR